MKSIEEIYSESMRSSLFTAYFTMGSFLLAAKSFIVLNMKKEVYDEESYRRNFDIQAKLDDQVRQAGPYRSLKTLACLLYWNIVAAFLTSLIQFSLGLVQSRFSTIACLSAAVITLAYTMISLFFIKRNLNKLFSWTDRIKREKEEVKAKEAKAKDSAG